MAELLVEYWRPIQTEPVGLLFLVNIAHQELLRSLQRSPAQPFSQSPGSAPVPGQCLLAGYCPSECVKVKIKMAHR